MAKKHQSVLRSRCSKEQERLAKVYAVNSSWFGPVYIKHEGQPNQHYARVNDMRNRKYYKKACHRAVRQYWNCQLNQLDLEDVSAPREHAFDNRLAEFWRELF